jgi:hypothetical protein
MGAAPVLAPKRSALNPPLAERASTSATTTPTFAGVLNDGRVSEPIFMVCTSTWAFAGERLITLTLSGCCKFLGTDRD